MVYHLHLEPDDIDARKVLYRVYFELKHSKPA
jgi:hypothetical protein